MSLLSQGYQYLTETRFDQIEPVLEIVRREIIALGLPLRSIEVELGPSQCEFTFQPQVGLSPADTMMLFRSAVKQICRRQGYHASFMCRPKVAERAVKRLAPAPIAARPAHRTPMLSRRTTRKCSRRMGRNFLAGLLAHARAAAAFTTPTINGYKRYRSYSLAPDRVIWGRDNRGVMIRVLGSRRSRRRGSKTGSASRPPIRISTWPRRSSPVSTAWSACSSPDPRRIPPTRRRRNCCRRASMRRCARCAMIPAWRTGSAADFIDYYLRIKEAEIARYRAEVTEWEQREYFELF